MAPALEALALHQIEPNSSGFGGQSDDGRSRRFDSRSSTMSLQSIDIAHSTGANAAVPVNTPSAAQRHIAPSPAAASVHSRKTSLLSYDESFDIHCGNRVDHGGPDNGTQSPIDASINLPPMPDYHDFETDPPLVLYDNDLELDWCEDAEHSSPGKGTQKAISHTAIGSSNVAESSSPDTTIMKQKDKRDTALSACRALMRAVADMDITDGLVSHADVAIMYAAQAASHAIEANGESP